MKRNELRRICAIGLFLSFNFFGNARGSEQVVCSHFMDMDAATLNCRVSQYSLSAGGAEIKTVQLQLHGELTLAQLKASQLEFTIKKAGEADPIGYIDFSEFSITAETPAPKGCHTTVDCGNGNTLKCGTSYGYCGGKTGVGCFSAGIDRNSQGQAYLDVKITSCNP